MASKATVGSLRVHLGLDSAQFTAGLTKAQTGLQRFAGVARTGALVVGTAMVAAGGAMAVAMKGIIDHADKMSKLSQSIGVPIEELSKLAYAAQMADIDLDQLEKAVRRLSAGMLDASEKATGPAALAFAALGISVRDVDGRMRTATAVIEDLAGRFARMPDGVQKTALAMRIFGKSGADMIPLLNEGADGLRAYYEEAEELGLVLDKDTGKKAEAFNDNLTRLGKVKQGIVTKITAHMLPALESLSGALVTASKKSGLMEQVGRGLGVTLQALATAAVTTSGFFIWLAQAISMAAEVGALWARNQTAAVVAAAKWQTRMDATMAATRDLNRAIWAPGAAAPPQVPALDDTAAAADRAGGSVEAASKEASDFWDVMESGKDTFAATRTPAEQYAATLKRIGNELKVNAIDQETYNRALADAKALFESNDPATLARVSIDDKARQFRQDSAEAMMDLNADHRAGMEDATYDGIRSGIEAAADGNLGDYLAMRIRGALFDRLADNLSDLFMGSKGGGGGLLGSLGSLRSWGSSLGSVFKHFSGGLPGFATGGSFRVGGQAGIDKNLVAFRATKGEMVDIRKPGAAMATGTPVNFDLRGAVMTPDLLRQMERMAAQSAGISIQTSRRAVPADQARRQRFDLGGGPET